MYYANSDIDWFCRINGVNIHVASMGHDIPDSVQNVLANIYPQVSAIDMAPWIGREGIWYNEEILRQWLRLEEPAMIARYLSTFTVMARKGFYSFAPLNIDPTDMDYYLMAKPALYQDFNIEGIVNRNVETFNIDEVNAFTAVPIVNLLSIE